MLNLELRQCSKPRVLTHVAAAAPKTVHRGASFRTVETSSNFSKYAASEDNIHVHRKAVAI